MYRFRSLKIGFGTVTVDTNVNATTKYFCNIVSTYIAIEETDSKNVNMIIYIREVRAKMLMVASKINYHIKIDNPLYLHKSSYILYMRRKRKYYVKLKHDNFLEVTFFRLFFFTELSTFCSKAMVLFNGNLVEEDMYLTCVRTHIGRIA